MLSSLIMLCTLLFFYSRSPINIVIIVIFLSFTICLILKTIFFTSWFSYILFLIFLGGLIVIFIYICRLASNEQISLDFNWIVFVSWVLAIFLFLKINFLKIEFKINTFRLESILSLFNQRIIFISIVYLLLTLFVSVQVTKIKFGPVRTKKL